MGCPQERTPVMVTAGMLVLFLMGAATSGTGDLDSREVRAPASDRSEIRPGAWRAWLDCEGHELPFELVLSDGPGGWRALIKNGQEDVQVDRLVFSGESVTLEFTQYDAFIQARILEQGRRLEGIWRRRIGQDTWAELPFRADWGGGSRFLPGAAEEGHAAGSRIDGRWQVRFEGLDKPVVGLFASFPGGRAEGTFLTSTGDYRFLAGDFLDGRLRLSRFDGANAFLVHATLQRDGQLVGRFWEGGYRRDVWHGTRTDKAAMPDPFGAFKWQGSIDLSRLLFPGLDGEIISLAAEEFNSKVLILEIFGTWCPNCHDASRLLQDLYERYSGAGLQVIGIAFEMTGDLQRNADLVKLYRDRNDLQYPLVLSGRDRNRSPQEVFPMLEGQYGYPTILFLGGDGRIRAVHTGFTGPATGEAYTRLQADFEALVREMLAEPARGPSAAFDGAGGLR
jgi:thiol-disulfide isomerase/thioredoxin